MMKTIFYSLLFLLPVLGNAQNIVDELFSDLKQDEDNTVVFVSGKLFDMASVFIPEDEEIEDIGKVKELVKTVEAFNLVMTRDGENRQADYAAGKQKLDGSMEELVLFRDKDNKVAVYVDEENGVVYELAGIGVSKEKFLVFSLKGAFDLDEIGTLIQRVQKEAVKDVEIRSEVNIDEFKVYPNPVSLDSEFTIELPTEIEKVHVQVYDVSGNRVKSIDNPNARETIRTSDLAPGNYIIELAGQGISVKKKIVVVK